VYKLGSELVLLKMTHRHVWRNYIEICIYYNAYLIEFMSLQLRLCPLENMPLNEYWLIDWLKRTCPRSLNSNRFPYISSLSCKSNRKNFRQRPNGQPVTCPAISKFSFYHHKQWVTTKILGQDTRTQLHILSFDENTADWNIPSGRSRDGD